MKKNVEIDRSLRKPMIAKEDYPFLLILLMSAIIQFSAAGYLSTIEIKKVKEGALEVIKGISPRFAKLILQPMESAPRRIRTRIIRPEKKEEVRKEEVIASKEPVLPVEKRLIQVPERVEVRYKGLLGVIMAKKRPTEIPSRAVFSKVDELVKEIKKAEGEKGREDILSRLDIKGLERTEDVIKKAISAPTEAGPKDTSEIIKEKEGFLRVGDEKEKEAPVSIRKRGEEDVYKTILKYSGGLRYIYNNALRKDPSLKGKITVKMVISIDGKVVNAEVVSSTISSPEMEEAIIKRIYRWQFLELKTGEDFTIAYTFDFSPIS